MERKVHLKVSNEPGLLEFSALVQDVKGVALYRLARSTTRSYYLQHIGILTIGSRQPRLTVVQVYVQSIR